MSCNHNSDFKADYPLAIFFWLETNHRSHLHSKGCHAPMRTGFCGWHRTSRVGWEQQDSTWRRVRWSKSKHHSRLSLKDTPSRQTLPSSNSSKWACTRGNTTFRYLELVQRDKQANQISYLVLLGGSWSLGQLEEERPWGWGLLRFVRAAVINTVRPSHPTGFQFRGRKKNCHSCVISSLSPDVASCCSARWLNTPYTFAELLSCTPMTNLSQRLTLTPTRTEPILPFREQAKQCLLKRWPSGPWKLVKMLSRSKGCRQGSFIIMES